MASKSSVCQVKCLFLISAAKTLVLSLFHSSCPPTQREQQYQKAITTFLACFCVLKHNTCKETITNFGHRSLEHQVPKAFSSLLSKGGQYSFILFHHSAQDNE